MSNEQLVNIVQQKRLDYLKWFLLVSRLPEKERMRRASGLLERWMKEEGRRREPPTCGMN